MAAAAAPHNLEAEKCVLGAILINNAAFNQAAEVIDAQDFFRDAHRRIFEKMTGLSDRSEPVDLVTVKDELVLAGELDEVGGPAYIAALTDGVPRSANIEHYAKIVKEKSKLRQIIQAANDIVSRAYKGDHVGADVAVEKLLEQVGETTTARPKALTGRELIALPDVPPILTDWPFLATGTVAAIVAASGTGKTHLALRMSADLLRHGFRVGYVVLEGKGGLKKRLIALAQAFHLDDDHLDRIVFVQQLSLEDDRSIRAAASEIGFASVVFVDTFSRALGDLDENSANAVGRALNACTALGRAVGDAAVVVLHHTNRSTASERGSSAFRCGVDALAFLEDEGETCVLKVDKLRDDRPPAPRAFRLRAVPEADSAVLEDAYAVIAAKSESELTPKTLHVLRELRLVGKASTTELVENLKGRAVRSTVFGSLKDLERLGLARQEGRGTWVACASPKSSSDSNTKSDPSIGPESGLSAREVR